MNKNKNLTIPNYDPENVELTPEEKEYEAAIERGEYVRAKDADEISMLLKEAAKNYFGPKKDQKVTLKLNPRDFTKVKARAKRNRIPYQTLLSTLIHQFAEEEIELRI